MRFGFPKSEDESTLNELQEDEDLSTLTDITNFLKTKNTELEKTLQDENLDSLLVEIDLLMS